MKLSKEAYKLIRDWCVLIHTDNVRVRHYSRYFSFMSFCNDAQLFLEIPESEVIEFNAEIEEDEYIKLKVLEYAD